VIREFVPPEKKREAKQQTWRTDIVFVRQIHTKLKGYTTNPHDKLYDTSLYQIEGFQYIHSIPTCQDVVQRVARLV